MQIIASGSGSVLSTERTVSVDLAPKTSVTSFTDYSVRQEASTEQLKAQQWLIDTERLRDIEQKLRCWGCLSRHPDAERNVAWLLERLAHQTERVAELEARLQRAEWAHSLP